MSNKSVLKIIFRKFFEAGIFILFVWILNFISGYFSNYIFSEIVIFANANISFVLTILAILLLGRLFMLFIFPFSIPAPLLSAFGMTLTISFIFRILELISFLIQSEFYENVMGYENLVKVILFIVISLAGYISILAKLEKSDDEKKEIEWKDVGEEFKLALYEIAKAIRRIFVREEIKKSKKKK